MNLECTVPTYCFDKLISVAHTKYGLCFYGRSLAKQTFFERKMHETFLLCCWTVVAPTKKVSIKINCINWHKMYWYCMLWVLEIQKFRLKFVVIPEHGTLPSNLCIFSRRKVEEFLEFCSTFRLKLVLGSVRTHNVMHVNVKFVCFGWLLRFKYIFKVKWKDLARRTFKNYVEQTVICKSSSYKVGWVEVLCFL